MSRRKVFLCPNCHGAGEVDTDQETSNISIICPCGFHGYVKDGRLLTPKPGEVGAPGYWDHPDGWLKVGNNTHLCPQCKDRALEPEGEARHDR